MESQGDKYEQSGVNQTNLREIQHHKEYSSTEAMSKNKEVTQKSQIFTCLKVFVFSLSALWLPVLLTSSSVLTN
jgi:hypothetical protein